MTLSPSQSSLICLLPPLQRRHRAPLIDGEVVIHAPGFEDRTMAVTEAFLPTTGARGILLDYRPFNKRNRLRNVRDGLLAHGIRVTDDNIIPYHRFGPGDFEKRLASRLRDLRARRVVVDISTMSKLAIMLVLNICRSFNLEVRVLYSEVRFYGPSKKEFQNAKRNNEIHRPSLQVFTGIHGVVRVASLSSIAMQGQSTAALVFMSFNDALTQVLLNTVYPRRLFLINGRPPVHSWREEATAWIHEQVRREWATDNPVVASDEYKTPLPKRSVSTLDYRETVALLLDLYCLLSANHRVLLAPSGSKLQAVGSYLVKALHPDIHIEYPSPGGFLPYYSSGAGAQWLLDVGRLSKLLATVSEAEGQEYLQIRT